MVIVWGRIVQAGTFIEPFLTYAVCCEEIKSGKNVLVSINLMIAYL